jgi:hypothetical protein
MFVTDKENILFANSSPLEFQQSWITGFYTMIEQLKMIGISNNMLVKRDTITMVQINYDSFLVTVVGTKSANLGILIDIAKDMKSVELPRI